MAFGTDELRWFQSLDSRRSSPKPQETNLVKRERGVVVSMMYERGFGFLTPKEKSPGSEVTEIFFHESACNGTYETIVPGNEVTYKLVNTAKGLRALDVRKEDVPSKTP